MTMHTEGPWSAAETRHNYDTIIRGPNGEPIALALVDGYTKQEGAANTALLAAAPDLLEALQRIAAGQEMSGVFTFADVVLRYQEIARAAIARAAIARATGEQP